jgi:phage gpG-like protein
VSCNRSTAPNGAVENRLSILRKSHRKTDAAVHQFGTGRAGKRHNIVIPARPFLGLSSEDEVMALDILNNFIRAGR